MLPDKVGPYRLIEPIGKGGMGTVYKAAAPDGTVVAVKVLSSHLTGNEIQRSRFYQEARLAMRLEHPNIVRALEVGEDEGQHFFAMEYVAGENLGVRLKRVKTLPERDAVQIIAVVARALHKAHREGLVHRDVKPDNILLGPGNEVKVADMGLAKELDTDLNLTRTGRGLGTPHFMAPEQFRDAKHADVRCDVYSLGATLYTMLTGEIPFRGTGPLDTFVKKSKNDYTPVEDLVPDISERTATVVRLAMSADPNRRPATARHFAELLVGKQKITDAVQEPAKMVYVLFDAEDGDTQKIKGAPSAIRSRLRKRLIPIDARAAYARRGPYVPITHMPEFKEFAEKRPVRKRNETPSSFSTSTIESREFAAVPLLPDSTVEKLPDQNRWLMGVAIGLASLLVLVIGISLFLLLR